VYPLFKDNGKRYSIHIILQHLLIFFFLEFISNVNPLIANEFKMSFKVFRWKFNKFLHSLTPSWISVYQHIFHQYSRTVHHYIGGAYSWRTHYWSHYFRWSRMLHSPRSINSGQMTGCKKVSERTDFPNINDVTVQKAKIFKLPLFCGFEY